MPGPAMTECAPPPPPCMGQPPAFAAAATLPASLPKRNKIQRTNAHSFHSLTTVRMKGIKKGSGNEVIGKAPCGLENRTYLNLLSIIIGQCPALTLFSGVSIREWKKIRGTIHFRESQYDKAFVLELLSIILGQDPTSPLLQVESIKTDRHIHSIGDPINRRSNQ